MVSNDKCLVVAGICTAVQNMCHAAILIDENEENLELDVQIINSRS